MPGEAARRLETRRAFDAVAADYDGPRGNNALVQGMRRVLLETVTRVVRPGARLADLGCGTGLDASYLGNRGYRVVAIDSSSRMVHETRRRIRDLRLEERVTVLRRDIQHLEGFEDRSFDAMYSNLGALNCVPDLAAVARACARLVRPQGRLVFSVIGRYCPWELLFYLLAGRPRRALLRFRPEMIPVGLCDGTVWTRYYAPREFFSPFESEFVLTRYRAVALFVPPPYLIALYTKARAFCEAASQLDDRVGGWPVVRNAGDHFLMVLTKRG